MPQDKVKDERMWAMLCHLTGLSIFIGVPFGNIIVPLIIWLIKKEEYPFVAEQGKEALNFQISMTIYSIVAGVLWLVFIGILLVPAIIIVDLIFVINAAVKANKGEGYKYPLAIKFIQ
ncbi:MAG: DUF4870 domain-containing protein [Candidatus Omnitrophica bacterium]|nr:DUF4870 domain-containing protein [Candidatus Omnitrophota bacterium]